VTQDKENLGPMIMPYDENLLERTRTQWQFGDWQSLSQLSRESLQHHPDRAKLSLLAAAGRLQTGEYSEAKAYIRLAEDWGVSKKLIGQVLIAGVHNSIARAAAITNQQQRALEHFEDALKLVTPGADSKLLIHAHTARLYSQMGVPSADQTPKYDIETTSKAKLGLSPLSKSIEILADTLNQQKIEIENQIKNQNDSLNGLRKHLDKKIKNEILNATQQLEAFLDIQSFFSTGKHLPSMHGWPVSPDFARFLIQLLEKNDYDLILEFGSGTSTILIAKTLAKLNHLSQHKTSVMQVAFEHLEKYHAQTLADLKNAGLQNAVELVLAQLKPYKSHNGDTYVYYDCQKILAEFSSNLKAYPARILLVVDGPPASTGRHARYPCLPIVLEHFRHQKIDLLLDDYSRSDEKEIGSLWKQDLEKLDYKFSFDEIEMEKGALLISEICL
jgi:hypothetical protein